MPNRLKSILLVSLQFLFIFLLLSGSILRNIPAWAYAFFILSLLLVFWAIASMQKSKWRIFPEPAEKATLVTNGPYRFVRHPMYTSILLGVVGLLISYFTWMRLLVSIALLLVLIIKLSWEEKMLFRKFDDYINYSKQTSKLFPFIY